MIKKILRSYLTATFIIICISSFSQEKYRNSGFSSARIDSLKKAGFIIIDTTRKNGIAFSTEQSVKFLQQRLQPQYWNDNHNPFRQALGQLIFEASNPPFDSARNVLRKYPYDSLSIPWDKFYVWEPLKIKSQDKKLTDTTILVVTDTLDKVLSSNPAFPFKYFNFPYQGDSIEVAVKSLLKYIEDRDSTVINFRGAGNNVTSVWLNSKSDRMTRYWLKNEFSDSVTVWIGNSSRDTIGLYLEQGVNFRRPARQGNYSAARINVKPTDKTKLLASQKIAIKTQYWKYRSETALILSQSALSNWVRGGENSISTVADITGYIDYSNKPLKLSSDNFVRLKLGFLKSGDNPVRKNVDLLETNSKLNHKAFGRFDFSAILLFKTQVAPGYNYAAEPSVLVSKFLNPAILTVGLGLDFKPDKKTSINFSPFSYKGTFVTDTSKIDQTNYGIAKNRKSLNEPGASFMITNEYKPVRNVTITNRLQLFTNYINKPQNIDVDWEMIAVVNLNWFTDVRFNTHLIFDDDTRTVELDKNKKPVLRPDGSQKKTARIQFKELLGFSLVFRF